MIFINLEINKILENTKEKVDNVIQDYCNELSSYLKNTDNKNKIAENTLDLLKTFNNEINDKYYYIVSGNEFFNVQTYENGKCISSGRMHQSEFPDNTEIGTALRWKNGKFVIDKQLTDNLAKQEKEIDDSIENLYNSFKTEGTHYKVEEFEGDYITLINQDTGVSFSETDFSKELYDSLNYDTILKFENGRYVIDNNYLKDKVEKNIDEDELIAQTIKEVKGKSNEVNIVEKILDFVSDSLIEIIESKGYGDSNTYFVMGEKDGKVNVTQRFGNLTSGCVEVENKAGDIEFGTILRKKDGKFMVDKELTEKSMNKIRELEKKDT